MNNQNQNCSRQKHVHEVTGSTAVVQECRDCHSHRFCTMSGEAIQAGSSHVHEVKFKTDHTDGHQHEFCTKSSTAINVGNGKHVHFIYDVTEVEDGHRHQLQAATLIESPIDFKKCD